MEPIDQLAPASGQREYRYAGAGLTWIGGYSVFFGLLMVVIGIGGLYLVTTDFHRDPSSVHGPLWVFWLFLTLVAVGGVAIVSAGLAYLMALWREKIVVTPTQVAWVNRWGVEQVRCSFAQIRHIEETSLSQPSSSRYAPMHHKCTVATDAGPIVFSDNIAQYDQLKAFFLAHETNKEDHGVFRYRSAAMFVIAAIVMPATALLFVTFLNGYLNGDPMSVNGVMEPTPIYVPLFAALVGVMFWVVLGGVCLTCLFERIVVSGGRLTFTNRFGIRRVDVPLTMVERNSFVSDDSLIGRGGTRYWVMTPQGRVKWSDQITGCMDLVRILSQASNQSPLGADPDQPKPGTGNPWV